MQIQVAFKCAGVKGGEGCAVFLNVYFIASFVYGVFGVKPIGN